VFQRRIGILALPPEGQVPGDPQQPVREAVGLLPALRSSRPAISASWAMSSASTMWAPRLMMNSFTRP
jgi:hypothetical protein